MLVRENMQYLCAILWLTYGALALREAHTVHRRLKAAADLIRRWASLRRGMTPAEVTRTVGSPVQAVATKDGSQWRYRVAGELRNVRFRRGRAVIWDRQLDA